jgi:hypothetical protein
MVRCISHTKNGGGQCRNQTVNLTWPCCWQHTIHGAVDTGSPGATCGSQAPLTAYRRQRKSSTWNLRVKPTLLRDRNGHPLPMLGLFAYNGKPNDTTTILFHQGDTICEYTGRLMLESSEEARRSVYNVEIGRDENGNQMVLAADQFEGSTVGRYANDKGLYFGAHNTYLYDSRRNNAELSNPAYTVPLEQRRIFLIARRAIRNNEEICLAYGRPYWEEQGYLKPIEKVPPRRRRL